MESWLLATILHLGAVSAQANPAAPSGTTYGWVDQANGRGTFDILWGSLFTIFLCTWTSLHLNIPALKERRIHRWLRKLRWMVQAIMGPEFVVAFATGQKVEARRSVEQWKRSGYTGWTMRHGFYANMGGFIVEPRDSKPFPVNSKQLHYLVTRGYTPFPLITGKEIWDKSKQDGFQKILTLVQTLWFSIQVLGRAIQHLPITTLELQTFGFVFCTFAAYYQWSNKPLDVESPTFIKLEASTAQILVEAGNLPGASKPYSFTPLDFIDNQSPSWLTEIQPRLHFRMGPRERPLPRFTNDKFPVIGASRDAFVLFTVIMAYCCLHFIAWKFFFPTHTERILWHVGCIVIVATTFIFLACETYQDGHRLGRWQRWYLKLFPKNPVHLARVDTMEKRRREMEFVPFWEVVIMSPVTMVYTLARTYIIVEVFVSLRSLPSGAFNSVNWSNFIPHV
ncbi:hypothetical protein JMJ35_008276 [Cladonia borealis]|uniref:Uncharacterized protein n=1 Tax=Cladonia borealis TaxID=184061 RepID=A0AA39V6V6_9LECA|nr:hypothetical protein JMJ35_008276 [Cladonia borealis]